MAVSLNDSIKVTPVVQIIQGSDLPLNIARAVPAIGRISSSLILLKHNAAYLVATVPLGIGQICTK